MNFFDAFISYGRADSKAFATKLSERLTAIGLNVWFDQEDIEDTVKWQKAIDRGIETTHNFIFIVAPHAVKSPYCLQEIELAVKYHKRLIPLLYIESKDCWAQLHPAIGEIQFIPFQEGSNNFEVSFNRLVSSIHKQEDYVYQHTKFLIQALEWEKNQKQTNYLLIGEERQEAEDWLKRRLDGQFPCIPTDLHCEFIGESTKNANNLMAQVFLASSDKDEAIKEKIRKTLMREGLTIWTNKTDIKTGSAFQQEINQGIEGADNFVYLMSTDSLESEYCQQELAQALANNKRIIPLLIEANGEIPPTPLIKGGYDRLRG
ncbi:MAG: toll/interleukin-1 receptor domain-containing protein, partial [Microcystaceae cyanobacterium]